MNLLTECLSILLSYGHISVWLDQQCGFVCVRVSASVFALFFIWMCPFTLASCSLYPVHSLLFLCSHLFCSVFLWSFRLFFGHRRRRRRRRLCPCFVTSHVTRCLLYLLIVRVFCYFICVAVWMRSICFPLVFPLCINSWYFAFLATKTHTHKQTLSRAFQLARSFSLSLAQFHFILLALCTNEQCAPTTHNNIYHAIYIYVYIYLNRPLSWSLNINKLSKSQ